MKFLDSKFLIYKVIGLVIVLILVIGLVNRFLNFNLLEFLGIQFGESSVTGVRVTVTQELAAPVFEIASLEIFHPKNMSVIEVENQEWWRLNIGTVFIFIEYDSYVKLGVRDPQSIKTERIDKTVYVDKDSIFIEILDIRLTNYSHYRTFTSNPFVLSNVSPDHIFLAMREQENELWERIITSGRANFDSAKKSFMDNYEVLCNSMDLEVVWR